MRDESVHSLDDGTDPAGATGSHGPCRPLPETAGHSPCAGPLPFPRAEQTYRSYARPLLAAADAAYRRDVATLRELVESGWFWRSMPEAPR